MFKKALLIGTLAATLCLALGGCGLKGPLYLPNEEPPAAAAE